MLQFTAGISDPVNLPMLVDFVADYAPPYSGEVTLHWDLGDGETAEGLGLTHGYASPGTYEVTLTMYWGGTCSLSVTQSITIADGQATPTPTPTPDPEELALSIVGYAQEVAEDALDPVDFFVNEDDDNDNEVTDQTEFPVLDEDELVALSLRVPASSEAFQFYIDVPYGDCGVKSWLDSEKGAELPLENVGSVTPGTTRFQAVFASSAAVPERIYIEGTSTGTNPVPQSDAFTFVLAYAEPLPLHAPPKVFMKAKLRSQLVGLLERETYSYKAKVRALSQAFTGNTGVVLSVGDSQSANWHYDPKAYEGLFDEEKKILERTNYGKSPYTKDGWYLVRTDFWTARRTYTAAGALPMWSAAGPAATGPSGNIIDKFRTLPHPLFGSDLFPDIQTLVNTYEPEVVVVMLGTNDVNRAITDVKDNTTTKANYKANAKKVADIVIESNAVPVLVCPPPAYFGAAPWNADKKFIRLGEYCDAIKEVGADLKIPVIDFPRLMRDMIDGVAVTDDLLRVRYISDDKYHLNVGLDGTKFRYSRYDLSRNGHMLHTWAVMNKLIYVYKAMDGN